MLASESCSRIKYIVIPMWSISFLENTRVFLASLEQRCLIVHLSQYNTSCQTHFRLVGVVGMELFHNTQRSSQYSKWLILMAQAIRKIIFQPLVYHMFSLTLQRFAVFWGALRAISIEDYSYFQHSSITHRPLRVSLLSHHLMSRLRLLRSEGRSRSQISFSQTDNYWRALETACLRPEDCW